MHWTNYHQFSWIRQIFLYVEWHAVKCCYMMYFELFSLLNRILLFINKSFNVERRFILMTENAYAKRQAELQQTPSETTNAICIFNQYYFFVFISYITEIYIVRARLLHYTTEKISEYFVTLKCWANIEKTKTVGNSSGRSRTDCQTHMVLKYSNVMWLWTEWMSVHVR